MSKQVKISDEFPYFLGKLQLDFSVYASCCCGSLMQILTWSTEWQFKKRHFASTQGIHNLISLHFLQLRYQSTKSPPKFCIASSLSLPTRASKTVKKSFSIIWIFSFTIFGAKIQIFANQNKFNFRRENSNICKSEFYLDFGWENSNYLKSEEIRFLARKFK